MYPKPWEEVGLFCPENQPYHQPHPMPWYTGESVFAEHPGYHAGHMIDGKFHPSETAQVYPPEGASFYHIVIPESNAHQPPLLIIGDTLTSPAARQEQVRRIMLAEDGCVNYVNYDVHAVYMMTRKPDDTFLYYEVEPQGRIWCDPEMPLPHHTSGELQGWHWCCDSASIVDRNIPLENMVYELSTKYPVGSWSEDSQDITDRILQASGVMNVDEHPAKLEQFEHDFREKIQEILYRYKNSDASIILHHPAVLLVFERLEHDRFSLKESWNNLLPNDEFEILQSIWGK